MRSLFINLMIWLPLAGLVPMGLGFRQLLRFLREVPAIDSPEQLGRFRDLAARQMILALVQIVVLLSPWLVFAVGLARQDLAVPDAIYSTASFVVILVAGLLMKSTERRVQSLPTATLELQAERDQIVHVWLHRPLPTWHRR